MRLYKIETKSGFEETYMHVFTGYRKLSDMCAMNISEWILNMTLATNTRLYRHVVSKYIPKYHSFKYLHHSIHP